MVKTPEIPLSTPSLGSHSHLLFLPSAAFWLAFSLSHSSILISRLADKKIPFPEYAYLIGFVLWLSIGIPYLYRIHKLARSRDYAPHTIHSIIPLRLFLVMLSCCWLTSFNLIRMPRTMFLEFHFFVPFLVLLQYHIMLNLHVYSHGEALARIYSSRPMRTFCMTASTSPGKRESCRCQVHGGESFSAVRYHGIGGSGIHKYSRMISLHEAAAKS